MSNITPSLRLAGLDDLLLYRLSRFNALAGAMVVRLCEGGYGITRHEWRVLGLMKEGEVLTSSALSERIQMDKARTSRLISELTRRGLLNREVPPGNRREVRLSLTPVGVKLSQDLMPQAREINRSILSVLTEEEMVSLDKLIVKLQHSAEQVSLTTQPQLPKTQRRLGRGVKDRLS